MDDAFLKEVQTDRIFISYIMEVRVFLDEVRNPSGHLLDAATMLVECRTVICMKH